MPEPITTIRNLDPAMARSFAAAGIRDTATLRAIGADEAYARLVASGSRPHFIAYCAIAMGLQGRPWTDCTGTEKVALRRRYDALIAGTRSCSEDADPDDDPAANARRTDSGRARLDAALSEIGVIPRRRSQPTSSSPEKK
ncbi:MAG: TfoX/Sxy family DNA transformation protein [Rhodobacteraceae bacterium]|nr:TfoX/Sxy family DNA transformation protein [Paracoccaceae bacterium]